MSHLPKPNGHQDQRLDDRPPQDPLIGALAGLSEALLTILEEQEHSDHACARVTENTMFYMSWISTQTYRALTRW